MRAARRAVLAAALIGPGCQAIEPAHDAGFAPMGGGAAGGVTADATPFMPFGGGGGPTGGGLAPVGGGAAPVGGGEAPTSRCGSDVELTAAEIDPRPRIRSETVSIAVAMTGGQLVAVSGHSPDGGALIFRESAASWTPGGGRDDRDGLVGPRFTGDVGLEITGREASGCAASTTVDVRVVGDVLVSAGDGGLHAIANHGQPIGLYAQIADRALAGLAFVPADVDSDPPGFVVAVRDGGGEPGYIVRVDLDGRVIREFETLDIAGEPIYPEGRGPRRLLVDIGRGEVLADGDNRARIHRWTLDGAHQGYAEIPSQPTGNADLYGFGLSEGQPVVGQLDADSLYRIDAEGGSRILASVAASFTELIAVGDGHGDAVIAVTSGSGNSATATLFGPTGRELRTAALASNAWPENFALFGSGYLATAGRQIMLLDGDLSVIDSSWSGFSIDISQYAGIVWLDQ